jgi:hypothetical protein
MKVSWDYEIPDMMGKKQKFQTTNQQCSPPMLKSIPSFSFIADRISIILTS